MTEKLRRIDYSTAAKAAPLPRIVAPSRDERKGGRGSRMGSRRPPEGEEVRRTAKDDKKARPPKNKPGTFGIFIPSVRPEIRKKLHALAKGEGMNALDYYRRVLTEHAESTKVKEDGEAAPKKKARKAAAPKAKPKKADGEGKPEPEKAAPEAPAEEPKKEA